MRSGRPKEPIVLSQEEREQVEPHHEFSIPVAWFGEARAHRLARSRRYA